MHQRTVGGVAVGAIGLGAMPLSIPGRPDPERAIATVHAALDAGVTLIDMADAYSIDSRDVGHNERLVATALARYGGDTSDVLLATKGGHTRSPDGSWGLNGRPEYLRRACEASLRALGVPTIGLYQYHRPDPTVPYAETVGALRDLQKEGKIRLVGISNASVAQIDESIRVLGPGGLASVQNEFSPVFRSSQGELDYCSRLGIAFLPWSPLGGTGRAGRLGGGLGEFRTVAEQRGVSPQRVCLAWMLAKGPHVIPIPGSSRPETIRDSAAAADLELTPGEMARLDAA